MKQLRQFGQFWYDFIVGDDWVIAASIVVVLAVTALAARRWNAWPLIPIGVGLTLSQSLWRAARPRR